MGVALRRGHPRMAQDLLHDADVHTLLDEQRGGGVPGVVNPGIPHLGGVKDGLPHPPVLGTFDRPAVADGEHQVVVGPCAACPEPLLGLPLAVLAQQVQERGRALEGQLALALALPEDQAAARPHRAFVGVPGAVRSAWALDADVTLAGAAGLAGREVPVLLALRLAGPPVPSLTAPARVVAAVSPFGPLDLEPGPDHAGFQVYIGPAQAQGLALADAQRERDRPPGTVPPGRGHLQDAAGFVAGQWLGLGWGNRGGGDA